MLIPATADMAEVPAVHLQWSSQGDGQPLAQAPLEQGTIDFVTVWLETLFFTLLHLLLNLLPIILAQPVGESFWFKRRWISEL